VMSRQLYQREAPSDSYQLPPEGRTTNFSPASSEGVVGLGKDLVEQPHALIARERTTYNLVGASVRCRVSASRRDKCASITC